MCELTVSTSSLTARIQFIYLLHGLRANILSYQNIIKTSRFQILNVFILGTVSNSDKGSRPSSIVTNQSPTHRSGLPQFPEIVSVSNSAATRLAIGLPTRLVRNHAIKLITNRLERKPAVFTGDIRICQSFSILHFPDFLRPVRLVGRRRWSITLICTTSNL